MADHTKIEWTDATWNPVTGCSIVDAGCTNCYAMQLAGTRLKHHPSRSGLTRETGGRPKWTGEVRLNEQWLDQPLRWSKPRMIFVCAHSDLFHESVPDEWIDKVFAVMALAPQHTFQVLTKRPDRAARYLTALYSGERVVANAAIEIRQSVIGGLMAKEAFKAGYPNVWLGTSASDQASADLRVPHLLAAPAAVRFLSAEPLLGRVDLTEMDINGHIASRQLGRIGGYWINALTGRNDDMCRPCPDVPRLDWVIVGGESGLGARPMHPDWARSLRDQCVASGVPFFFKQVGEWAVEIDRERDDPDWRADYSRKFANEGQTRWLNIDGGSGFHGERFHVMRRVGKARAGRLLDGRTWDQMPDPRHD